MAYPGRHPGIAGTGQRSGPAPSLHHLNWALLVPAVFQSVFLQAGGPVPYNYYYDAGCRGAGEHLSGCSGGFENFALVVDWGYLQP